LWADFKKGLKLFCFITKLRSVLKQENTAYEAFGNGEQDNFDPTCWNSHGTDLDSGFIRTEKGS